MLSAPPVALARKVYLDMQQQLEQQISKREETMLKSRIIEDKLLRNQNSLLMKTKLNKYHHFQSQKKTNKRRETKRTLTKRQKMIP